MADAHYYLKKKVKALQGEYKGKDAAKIIHDAGGKCCLCGRKTGDTGVFGPTHYLRNKISFKVRVHIHVIKSEGTVHALPFCTVCHLGIHLYGRLEPSADLGGMTVGAVQSRSKRGSKVA